jgi:DNA (cytosine-5)-methyltransferase 1
MITVADFFCGAGGSSIGLTGAGMELKIAANHWTRAIETHASNFPNAEHLCADISAYDPRRIPKTDVAWFSPECTNFSNSKTHHVANLFDPASDPAAERSRATMWDVPRYAERHLYRAIMVENVVEVTRWVMWPAWRQAMELLGYDVQIVSLNSMVAWSGRDAAPQSRDRVYIVCTRGTRRPDLDIRPPVWCPKCEKQCEGRQSWKNGRTVGKFRSQYVYLCSSCFGEAWPLVLPAASAIDWSIACPRIGDRSKPLAENTMRRIRAGLDKFGPAAIAQMAGNTFERRPGVRTWPITSPLPTQTTTAAHGLIVETMYAGERTARSTELPWPTQTGRQSMALVTALRTHGATLPTNRYPLPTAVAGNVGMALVEPFIAELRGGGSESRPTSDPMCTVTASGNHHGLIVGPDRAFISKGYGDGNDPSMSIHPTQPLGTVTTQDHHAVVAVPFITEHYGQSVVRGIDEPLGAQATVTHHGLARPGGVDVDDCGFRMLTPAEIGRAQAFPVDYDVTGSARDKVRQYGNAVSPPAAALLAERILAVFS